MDYKLTLNDANWTRTANKSEWIGTIMGVSMRVYQYSNWGDLWLAIGKVNGGTIEEKLGQAQGSTPEEAVEKLLINFP